jgi:hypothetical protein
VDRIVSFYALKGTDDRGRTLPQMWAWDDHTLEGVHDYIQWMFPTEQASAFNPDAPLVGVDTRAAFAADPALRANLTRSLDRMLAFYGFEREAKTGTIVRAGTFDARSREWLTRGNHNHLRITRILDSLTLLSLPALAVAFFGALDDVYVRHSAAISRATYEFWSRMAEKARAPR